MKIGWCDTCLKLTTHSEKPWKCLKCSPKAIKKARAVAATNRGTNPRARKITADQAAEMLERKLAGESTASLAVAYGVSIQTAQDYIKGFTATKAMIVKWVDQRIDQRLKGKMK